MTPNTKSTSTANSLPQSNYAIVETSGKQFWIEPNRYYEFDRIKADVDETIVLDKVLLLNNEKGITLGKPYIEGATVELKVLAHKRGPKIIVYKMRPKKKTRRKNGHRQELTRVMVQSISTGSKTTSKTKTKTPKSDKVSTKASTAKQPSKVSSKEKAPKSSN